MEVPSCPDPSHAGSRVVRAGWYGKAPHRRQRWLCTPKRGDAHRFVGVLPRRERESCRCPECLTTVEVWEGPPQPRTYSFAAREIAYTLVSLARGNTYRSAAEVARAQAGWPLLGNGGSKARRRSAGQLAANWVDVWADVVTAPDLPTSWPEVLVVDPMSFRIGSGPNFGRRFQVIGVVGYDRYGGRMRVLRLEPAPDRKQATLEAVFRSLPGEPERVITDQDTAIAKAVRAVWPGAEHRWCESHLRKGIEAKLPPLVPTPAIKEKLGRAFLSPADWEAFDKEVRDADAALRGYKVAVKWLDRYGAQVLAQTAGRGAGPHSTGALEGKLREISIRLGDRTSRLTNRARLRRLLALMAASQNGKADETAWAARIEAYLLANAGQAPRQRTSDDPRGSTSLLGAPPPARAMTPRPTGSPGVPTEPFIHPLSGLPPEEMERLGIPPDAKPEGLDDDLPF